MKQVKLPHSVILHNDAAVRRNNIAHLLGIINELPEDEMQEVIIQCPKRSKTQAQLGALFGLWFDFLAKEAPGLNQDPVSVAKKNLHVQMKSMFLAEIYSKEPIGYIQRMWVEKLAHIGERLTSDNEATASKANADLNDHFTNMSLAWASVEQMREYMDSVYWYWQDQGYPPPIPEKFHRFYKDEARRYA